MKLVSLLCVLLLSGGTALAAPDIVVGSVQSPVWLERGAQRMPLMPGMELNSGDAIVTGLSSRVLLKAADGSDIKLGENARLVLSDLARKRDERGLFAATLNVAKGAFRFTTGALAKLRSREVTVRVAGATIGIRGTDVWGKDGDEMGVVCLIEGKIAVRGPDEREFVMDQPLQFYKMPKGAMPMPVGLIDANQLKKWAVETEIAEDQGELSANGRWKLTLLSASDSSAALAAYDEWRAAGYPVRIYPETDASGLRYSLRIEQCASRSDAEQLAASLTGRLEAGFPKISR
jgi:hypothetical protein